MKRFLCVIFVILLLFPYCASAKKYPGLGSNNEYTPAKAGDKSGEYEHGKYGDIILADHDLEHDTLCRTVKDIIENGALSKGMSVVSVRLVKGVLTIEITWPEDAYKPLTNGMYAQNCASNVTDAILEYEELDQFWDKISLVFPLRKATFTKSMIRKNEFGGRYIDEMQIYGQIAD